eukprot:8143594-Pyramimonas_sp.AAC.1
MQRVSEGSVSVGALERLASMCGVTNSGNLIRRICRIPHVSQFLLVPHIEFEALVASRPCGSVGFVHMSRTVLL